MDIDAQGLLAYDVDVVLQSLEHEFAVQRVGGADVDGVKASVEGGGQATVCMGYAQAVSRRPGTFHR